MKVFIFILCVFMLMSCEKSGEKYLGIWYGDRDHSNWRVRIEKAGDMYLVTEYNSEGVRIRNRFTFKGGCFVTDYQGNEIVCVCEDGNGGLVSVITGNQYK